MNNSFKKFKETGKIEYYIKYKSEVSKEFYAKEKKKNEDSGSSNKKS